MDHKFFFFFFLSKLCHKLLIIKFSPNSDIYGQQKKFQPNYFFQNYEFNKGIMFEKKKNLIFQLHSQFSYACAMLWSRPIYLSFSLLFPLSLILTFSLFSKEEEGDQRNKRKRKERGRKPAGVVGVKERRK